MDKKEIGLGIEAPTRECDDRDCPFHGTLKVHGKIFNGVVIRSKMAKTATIEFARYRYVPKDERYERKRTRIKAHNPPCINAVEGDKVKIVETRPLSKTKSFVIVESKK
jgi:small subunit ribosomal protein S17